MRAKRKKRTSSGTRTEKARTTRARRSEFDYRNLLDALEVGVASVTDKGIIEYSNPRFGDMVGAPPYESLQGSNLTSLVTASSWPELNTALQRSRRTQSEGRLELEGVSETRRTVRVSFVPLRSRTDRPRVGIVAIEVTRLVQATEALRNSEASVQNLSARLLRVQDEERRHIARDLHDTIGQELAMAVMRVEQIAKEIDSPEADIRKQLAECSEWLRKIETETRTLSYVLHPPLLDQIGLVPALKWYIEGFSKRSGLKVQLDLRSQIPRLEVDEETALFRIVQESLTNVLRHSGSTEAYVRVGVENSSVRVVVVDKGKGFKSDIQSTEQGTRVSATVPLRESISAAAIASESKHVPSRATPSAACPKPASSVSRILIADDHEIARRGIQDLFRGEADMVICGEARDGVETLARVEELHPDLLILDLSMPKLGGYSVANHLRRTNPTLKILVYSTHSHRGLERMVRSAGCGGCVHKANAARDLVRGARAILRGGEFYECEIPQDTTA